MFQDVLQALQQEISGEGALAYVAEIARHHRVQASPGFRRAAEYVCDELAKAGVQAEILSFPANNQTRYWSARMFQEWDCEEGTCRLVTGDGPDRKLADFREAKLSIIQRSCAGDVEGELVAIEGGADPADYAGLDLAGKVVLVGEDVGRAAELAVHQRGAVGILYDGIWDMPPVAERIDYADVRQYTSFWARGGGTPPMGFVLTPRQGDGLRKEIRERAHQGEAPLRVRMHVRSRMVDGAIEVVSALIPGSSSQEILLEAHLCHPQPSANDNGSGSAALIEAARVLTALIRDGKLPPLQRSIRLLWIPEMTGTYAYLSTHTADIPKMVAGLNLDMVGEDQDKCRSNLLLVRPPLVTHSFVPAVLEWVFGQIRGSGTSPYSFANWPLFRVFPKPFAAGSDHYIGSDPTVGVPCAMLGASPDKYWHTSGDTIDKVDPKALGFATTLTAGYAYWLATAGPDQARWLADEMVARFKREIVEVVQAYMTTLADAHAPTGPSLSTRVEFLTERQNAALATLKRLAEVDPGPWQQASSTFADWELAQAAQRCGGHVPERPIPSGKWESRAARMVPRRVFRGPIDNDELNLTPEDREALEALAIGFGTQKYASHRLAMYWTDGKRTLQQVCDKVELESGFRLTEFLVRFYEILAREGAITL